MGDKVDIGEMNNEQKNYQETEEKYNKNRESGSVKNSNLLPDGEVLDIESNRGDNDTVALPTPPGGHTGNHHAKPSNKGEKKGARSHQDHSDDGKGLSPANIARAISQGAKFARDMGGRLFYYESGVYHSNGEDYVRYSVKHTLQQWDKSDEWNSKLPEEVIAYLKADAPRLWQSPLDTIINLLNGLYDVRSQTLLPHTSDHLTAVQLPILYNPKATCPQWDKFLGDVFPEGVRLLHELLGILTVPYTGLQSCIFILGEGSNGKGTFLRAIESFLGTHNCSHVSLHQLENERFIRGNLVDKLVNVFGDVPIKKIENLNFFKALTGEDTITIEFKGRQPFSYKPFCRLLFSGNQTPTSNDSTEGYKRRWLILPFMRKFKVSSAGDDLLDSLSSVNEISGLFNKVAPLILSVIENGFTYSDSVAALVDRYIPTPPATAEWLERMVTYDEDACVHKDWFYSLYTQSCPLPAERSFSKGDLVTYIRSAFPNVTVKSMRIGSKLFHCFAGLRLTPLAIHYIIKNQDIPQVSGWAFRLGSGKVLSYIDQRGLLPIEIDLAPLSAKNFVM